MLFNSPVFLFLFLPIMLTGYYASKRWGSAWFNGRLPFGLLTLGSLFFYGWWAPVYLVLILGSITTNFFIARIIVTIRNTQGTHSGYAYTVVALGIVANLVTLGVFKYADFFVENLSFLTGVSFTTSQIILPLAISFFTFQQIAFLVDVYRGKAHETDFLTYCLFVSFFPQLIAGPIVHHAEMMPQFTRQREEQGPVWENLAVGTTIFVIGLFKKTIIADQMGAWSDQVFALPQQGVAPSLLVAWVGVSAFTFQIYFDFSGYSDMAIGLARMFGIKLPLNFDSPYKAANITDFWRRWHMTLSRFLRDYLYFPLGGNKRGPARRYVNLMIVMLLGGLWHGAAWTFVLWGGLHGLYLVLHRVWQKVAFHLRLRTDGLFRTALSRIATLFCIVVAWVMFRAETTDAAIAMYRGMAGLNGLILPQHYVQYFGDLSDWGVQFGAVQVYGGFMQLGWLGAALLFVWFLPSTQELTRRFEPALGYAPQTVSLLARIPALSWRPSMAIGVATGLVFTAMVLNILQGVQGEFIYFQF